MKERNFQDFEEVRIESKTSIISRKEPGEVLNIKTHRGPRDMWGL